MTVQMISTATLNAGSVGSYNISGNTPISNLTFTGIELTVNWYGVNNQGFVYSQLAILADMPNSKLLYLATLYASNAGLSSGTVSPVGLKTSQWWDGNAQLVIPQQAILYFQVQSMQGINAIGVTWNITGDPPGELPTTHWAASGDPSQAGYLSAGSGLAKPTMMHPAFKLGQREFNYD